MLQNPVQASLPPGSTMASFPGEFITLCLCGELICLPPIDDKLLGSRVCLHYLWIQTRHNAWHPAGATSFLSSESHISELQITQEDILRQRGLHHSQVPENMTSLCVSERIKSRFYTWINEETSWDKNENTYLSANRVMPLNKLYALCHLLPSTPPSTLRKEEAMKTHLL